MRERASIQPRTAAHPRLAILAMLAGLAVPAACSKPEPPIGDARGGIIEWFSTTKSQVEDAAAAHCARYGKKGRITQTTSDRSGGHAVFVCE